VIKVQHPNSILEQILANSNTDDFCTRNHKLSSLAKPLPNSRYYSPTNNDCHFAPEIIGPNDEY
jgi:hypothetical protein